MLIVYKIVMEARKETRLTRLEGQGGLGNIKLKNKHDPATDLM